MSWQDRDWARFTDAERDAIYGRRPATGRSRPLLVPGAGRAIAVSAAAALLLGQFPRSHPLLPVLHIGSSSALPAPLQTQRTFPLNLPATASYGGVLTLNGTDPNATSGNVVATGRWNGGPWTTLASGVLSANHSWSLPISMNQRGTLNLRVDLPSGDSLVGSVTVTGVSD